MPRWLIATAALAAAAASAPAQQPMSPRDSAVHALNRIAYGPEPGQPDSVARAGVMRWIDAQLDEKSESSRAVAARRREFSGVFASRDELARHFAEAERERRLMKEQPGGAANAGPMKAFRDLGGELAQWTVVRATLPTTSSRRS